MNNSPLLTTSLDEQQQAFLHRPFLAMPIAGAVIWALIGLVGAFSLLYVAVWAVFIGTGMIFYLGLLFARMTGEDLLGRQKDSPFFDRLFMHTVVMAVMVYAIAIPFFLIEPTSLPMTVGILTGLMWIPLSPMIQHWVGLFHGVSRTLLVVLAWYLFPDHRFVSIPFIIVAIYLVSIAALKTRVKKLSIDH